jgi:hypothetical protein
MTQHQTDEEKGTEERQTLPDRRSVRRVWWISLAAYVVIAASYAIRREFGSLVGLTCSALVVMINFLWLEEIAFKLLGPAPLVNPWKLGVRALGRYALLGLVAAVFVVRFNILSVLLGTSILVIGIMGEALYSWIASADEGVDR